MSDQEEKTAENVEEESKGTLAADSYDIEDVFEGAEDWIPAETKLVVWSFIVAAIALAIGGVLINIFILE